MSANFQVVSPKVARDNSLLGYAANGWSMSGIGIVQSGEPYSLYEYYGAVGSVYFGDYPTLLNPILPISDPKHAKTTGLTGNPGDFRDASGNYLPTVNPADIAINYLAPGAKGVPVSTGTDPQDIYETDFAPSNQRNIFRQAMQKRLDLSFRKTFTFSTRYNLVYNFDVYNVFNETSLDVPQNQTEIRQSDACSAAANAVKGSNCAADYVNYGQVATSNSATDQASALANLDRKPTYTGTGRATTIPVTSNGANFGSVTGTIGGNRAVVMGLHLTY